MALLVGNSSVGTFTNGAVANGNSGGRVVLMQYTAASTGTATHIYFYDNSTEENSRLVCYDNAGNLLGQTGQVGGGAGWISGAVLAGFSITNGQTYYVGRYVAAGYGFYLSNNVTPIYIAEAGSYTTPASSISPTTEALNQFAAYVDGSAGSPSTLSGPTPSGVIGTQNTATVGATTDQSNGTLYVVASATQAHITGITAAQVVAGQTSSSGTAPFSGNASVSTSTPSAGLAGLSGATLYYYAIAQVTGGGNSNVVTGSFTTAASTRSTSITLYNASNAVLASTNVRVWTRTGLTSAAADGSTAGLSLTTTAGGVLNVTNLTIAAGAGWLTVKDDTDDNICANYPVTYS